MNIENLYQIFTTKPGVTETFPFDNDTLVFKVMGKMFALTSLAEWEKGNCRINLKCDPQRAIELREEYDGLINPGWHMSKTHWNTVMINTGLEDKMVLELINHSYDLVVASLIKKLRAELDLLK
ncbi:MAG: MmcQ/YjbR family DNA-binding protein [Leeuwenhoekiella sp.]